MHSNSCAPAASRWAAIAGLVLAVAFGAGVRFSGIACLLPYGIESDGKILPAQVEDIRAGRTDAPSAAWQFYPHLVARAAALFPAGESRAPAAASLREHLAAARAPIEDVRRAVAWLSLAAIPATWLLARSFLSPLGAWIAAMGVASSLLTVWFAQQARPHAPAAAFVVLALWTCVRLRRTPTLARFVVAGAACGVAIGALQSGLAVLGALGAAHVLRARAERAPRASWRAAALLCLSLAIAACIGASFQPRADLHARPVEVAGLDYRGTSFEFYGHSVFLGLFNGGGFATVAETLWIFEPQWLVLGALALVPWRRASGAHARAVARSSASDVWVVLAYAVPYALAIGLYARTFERFVLPLVPLVVILGAAFAERVLERARVTRGRATLTAVVLALTAGAPAAAAVLLARVRGADDTPARAAQWIRDNLDPSEDRVLFIPYLDLPLLRNARALVEGTQTGWATPWRAYQQSFTPPLAGDTGYALHDLSRATADARTQLAEDPVLHFRALGMRYVAIALPYFPGDEPTIGHYHRALHRDAERVVRVTPIALGELGRSEAEADIALWFEYGARPYPAPLAWLLASSFEAPGPVIEIYRLP